MHAGFFVGRLRRGAEEVHPNAGEPFECGTRVLGQDAAEGDVLVLFTSAVGGDHVGDEVVDSVVDAVPVLVGGTGGSERAD